MTRILCMLAVFIATPALNTETGTFSIVKTTPGGLTCGADAGDGWHDLPTGDPV